MRYSCRMSLTTPTEIAIASYLESEWDQWRYSTVDGPEFFAGSYATWHDRLKQLIADKKREGFQVYRVDINVSEFLKWAKLNGRSTDAEARDEFAGLNLGQRFYN